MSEDHPTPLRDRPTLVVAGAYLLLGAVTGSIGPVSDQLRSELGLSATVTGFYGSAFGWVLLAAAVGGGPFRRRVGDRRLFGLGLGSIVAAVAVVCVARLVGPSLAGAVGIGLGATAVVLSGPGLVAARYRDPVERSDAFTLVNALSTAGSLVAPLTLAATLALAWGWRLPWFLIAAVVGVGVIVLTVSTELPVLPPSGEPAVGPLVVLRRSGSIRRRWLVLVLGIGIEFTALLWGSTVVQRLGDASASVGAVAVGLFGAGMLVGRLVGPAVTRGRDQGVVLRVVFAGALAATLAFRFLPGAWPRVAAMAAIGLCVSVIYPYAFNRLYGPRVADAEVSALGAFAAGVAISLAPPLLGAFADTFGIERAILLAPAMAVGALALLAFGDDGDELGPSQLR